MNSRKGRGAVSKQGTVRNGREAVRKGRRTVRKGRGTVRKDEKPLGKESGTVRKKLTDLVPPPLQEAEAAMYRGKGRPPSHYGSSS